MWLDELNEVVGRLKRRMEQHKEVLSKNETATRYALIDPLLTALAWDLSDPGQVQTEYKIGDRRADYAMFADGHTPRFVIETKKLDRPISDGIRQSIAYCIEEGILYFVVTNGRDWEVYEILKRGHLTDKRIVAFRLTDPTQTTVMKMLWLWRGNFEPESPAVPMVPDKPASRPTETSAPHPAAEEAPPEGKRTDRGVPLGEFSPRSGDRPPAALLFPNRTKKTIAKWYEIQASVVGWLIEAGRLTEADCPVKGPGGAHLVASSPFKRNGRDFHSPKQIHDLWIDGNKSARAHVKAAKDVLKARNVDLSDVRVIAET